MRKGERIIEEQKSSLFPLIWYRQKTKQSHVYFLGWNLSLLFYCPSLGAGEAGKTTIIKQMKLMHASGFTDEERALFRTYVFSNTVSAMRSIILEMQERHISLTHRHNEVCNTLC
jgi:hypothetical protein